MILISIIVLQNSATIQHKTNKLYSNNMNYIIIMIGIIVLQYSKTWNIKQTNNIVITWIK